MMPQNRREFLMRLAVDAIKSLLNSGAITAEMAAKRMARRGVPMSVALRVIAGK